MDEMEASPKTHASLGACTLRGGLKTSPLSTKKQLQNWTFVRGGVVLVSFIVHHSSFIIHHASYTDTIILLRIRLWGQRGVTIIEYYAEMGYKSGCTRRQGSRRLEEAKFMFRRLTWVPEVTCVFAVDTNIPVYTTAVHAKRECWGLRGLAA